MNKFDQLIADAKAGFAMGYKPCQHHFITVKKSECDILCCGVSAAMLFRNNITPDVARVKSIIQFFPNGDFTKSLEQHYGLTKDEAWGFVRGFDSFPQENEIIRKRS